MLQIRLLLRDLSLTMLILGIASAASGQARELRDEFFWLNQMNKATLVINTDEGLLAKDKAPHIARGIFKLIEDGRVEKGARPSTVLSYEPLLIKASSPDATLLHAGRSSQDMHATYRAAMLRDDLLDLMDALNSMQSTLLKLAAMHSEVIVPNYTNGVAAQPNALGHYLLGHAAGFDRDAQRLKEAYQRINRSAMGTTVLNGTSWPLNRQRMGEYLGFPAIVENAYDASQISSMEHPVEIGGLLTGIALHVGHFVEDVMTQYAQSTPWILLETGGGNTYASSAMPQKKNPGLLNDTRTDASSLIGMAIAPVIRAHNITPGMSDPKSSKQNSEMIKSAVSLIKKFDRLLQSLRVNKERALDELNNDWTASQEMADLLMRKYNIPFRIGHHFASSLVDYAKSKNIKPSEFKYSDAQAIFIKSVKDYPTYSSLPLLEQEFKDSLNPELIIKRRATLGGPQPSEMRRMLALYEDLMQANKKWVKSQRSHIDHQLKKLDEDFSILKSEN